MENTRLFNLIMLMRTNDVDLRLYAQNEIKKYSEKVAALIKKYIKSENVQEDVKAMKKLSAAYHVNVQDDWLAQMCKKYGNNNVKVVERVLKSL